MKFRTRIILVYTVFVLSIALLVSGFFYYASSRRSVNRELGELEDLARQLCQQYDASINAMKHVSQMILSDADTLEAIRALAALPKGADSMLLYFSEPMDEVRSMLNTDYILRNFYKVIFFNEAGVVVATDHAGRKLNVHASIESLTWLTKLTAVDYGDFAVLGLHPDDWGEKSREVFSVVKQLQGENLGYIEVQRTADDLNALFALSNPAIKVLLLGAKGEILFSNGAYGGDAGYAQMLPADGAGAALGQNLASGQDELVAGRMSAETGACLVVAEQYDTLHSELRYVFILTLTLAASFIGLAIVYILAASHHLTKPIRQLERLMAQTDIDNISADVGLKAGNDEINHLRQSYESMLKRLDSAIIKEKRISAIQFQAQFDALQAQVNPHFIYNVLNVISSRGVLNEDAVICEICDDLAAMLRYSTNTKERYATVGREVEYLAAYSKLLKCRYEHRLSYTIDIDPVVTEYPLPKIVLQQLVENSIAHGYEKGVCQTMHIEVTAWQDAHGWYIRVRDNGDGFSPQALAHVRTEIEEIRLQISSLQKSIELEIGGMGIVNTYARLYLLYGQRLVFQVDNCEQGAQVLLGIHNQQKEA